MLSCEIGLNKINGRKYGVVYTPQSLSDFVATLLKRVSNAGQVKSILDPASGECSLLVAAQKVFGREVSYFGIEIENQTANATKNKFNIFHNDAVIPFHCNDKSADYWKRTLPKIDAIIANPPWSSEKIYDMQQLKNAGFSLATGQFDSYVLFIELAFNILHDNGIMAFIIPDSIFDSQNINLRKFLLEKMEIKVIARLGEKIFENINRATTVIICKKSVPTINSKTECFRLSTDNRKEYLQGKNPLIKYYDAGKHTVNQSRFLENKNYVFDIDARADEETLLDKLAETHIDWEKLFTFGRGVEISKTGKIVYCPICHYAQGYKNNHLLFGEKECTKCGTKIPVTVNTIRSIISNIPYDDSLLIYVGENIKRYKIEGANYIRTNINGINYKNYEMYKPPKLLIRKTGLGLYAALDYSGSFTSQTVYILKYANTCINDPLEYYLALINSRTVYYYYLKVYGENEWKSHPYLTKQILFSLPLRPFTASALDWEIVRYSKELMVEYNHNLDCQLENLVMDKYKLSKREQNLIVDTMNSLPNLSAINDMKVGA